MSAVTITDYRGAVVEDLDLQPALTVYASDPIDKVLVAAYEREFSQVPVLNNEQAKKIIGYINADTLLKQKSVSTNKTSVIDWTIRFKSRTNDFIVISPTTPLEELDVFLQSNEFAIGELCLDGPARSHKSHSDRPPAEVRAGRSDAS